LRAISKYNIANHTVAKGLEAAGPTEQEVPDLDEDLSAGMITPLSN